MPLSCNSNKSLKNLTAIGDGVRAPLSHWHTAARFTANSRANWACVIPNLLRIRVICPGVISLTKLTYVSSIVKRILRRRHSRAVTSQV